MQYNFAIDDLSAVETECACEQTVTTVHVVNSAVSVFWGESADWCGQISRTGLLLCQKAESCCLYNHLKP